MRQQKKRISALDFVLLLSIAVSSLTLLPAHAQEQTPPVAAATTVATGRTIALLPVANLSGEKDEKQRTDQRKRAEEELAKQFKENGFTLIAPDVVEKALADAKIDVNDEEFHNRATLLRVGKAVNADLVAFVVITDVDQRRVKTAFDNNEMVGKAKTKLWLLRVADETPLLNAVRHESQAKSNLLPGFDSGARLIRNSVAGAVRDTLKPFFQNKK